MVTKPPAYCSTELITTVKMFYDTPWKTYWRGRQGTIDPHTKEACFAKKEIKISIEKAAGLNKLVQ